jgi:hypothetical protein
MSTLWFGVFVSMTGERKRGFGAADSSDGMRRRLRARRMLERWQVVVRNR